MEYLLNWSGDMYGMRKARIPAVQNAGIVGHWRDGVCFVPDRAALLAALPARYRGMVERATPFWYDHHRNDGPATLHLCDVRGRYRHTLYLQPLG